VSGCATEALSCSNLKGYNLVSCLLSKSGQWSSNCRGAFENMLGKSQAPDFQPDINYVPGASSGSAINPLAGMSTFILLLFNPPLVLTRGFLIRIAACLLDLHLHCASTLDPTLIQFEFVCLVDNESKVSADCASALSSLRNDPNNSYKLPEGSEIACASEIDLYCKLPTKLNNLQCLTALVRNGDSLTSQCVNSLVPPQAGPLTQKDVEAGKIAGREACLVDKELLCKGTMGQAAVDCMISSASKISAVCKKMLEENPLPATKVQGCGFFDADTGNAKALLPQANLSKIVALAFQDIKAVVPTTASSETHLPESTSNSIRNAQCSIILPLILAVMMQAVHN
jgi:hypothetical protein